VRAENGVSFCQVYLPAALRCPEPALNDDPDLQENGLFLSFPYVCPEHVLVK
jgi:hypothetical protein